MTISFGEQNSYRILDVNFNRAKEGMRVCEDIARFHLNDKSLTTGLKKIRHELTHIFLKAHIERSRLYKERDPRGDIAKNSRLGSGHKTFKKIFMANAQRTKEALRVCEEFMKIFDPASSKKTQTLRFRFYDFEKKSVKKFPALLDS